VQLIAGIDARDERAVFTSYHDTQGACRMRLRRQNAVLRGTFHFAFQSRAADSHQCQFAKSDFGSCRISHWLAAAGQ